MKHILIKIFLLFACIAFCNSTYIFSSTARLEMVFYRYRVVPYILRDFPGQVLPVSNHNTLGGTEPLPGSKLRKSFFETKPCIKMQMDDENGTKYSTAIVYDADVCCHGRNLLWMWKNNLVGQKTDEQTDYYSPSGCRKVHRIIYLVYQHSYPLDFDLYNFVENGQNATHFNLTYFVEHYNLSAPVQGNIFLASLDDDAFLATYMLVVAYIFTIITLYYFLKCLFSNYVK